MHFPNRRDTPPYLFCVHILTRDFYYGLLFFFFQGEYFKYYVMIDSIEKWNKFAHALCDCFSYVGHHFNQYIEWRHARGLSPARFVVARHAIEIPFFYLFSRFNIFPQLLVLLTERRAIWEDAIDPPSDLSFFLTYPRGNLRRLRVKRFLSLSLSLFSFYPRPVHLYLGAVSSAYSLGWFQWPASHIHVTSSSTSCRRRCSAERRVQPPRSPPEWSERKEPPSFLLFLFSLLSLSLSLSLSPRRSLIVVRTVCPWIDCHRHRLLLCPLSRRHRRRHHRLHRHE